MIKGIYTPLSGAVAQERVLEVISNNLANMNTTAFKGEKVSFTVIDAEPYKHYKTPLPPANYKVPFDKFANPRGNELSYVAVDSVEKDMSQGPVVQTGNSTDLMIEGKGFLSVMTPEGVRYTRDGSLSLNTDGVLTTKGGAPILGEKGNIYVRGTQFNVNYRGEVYLDGKMVDRILLYEFKDPKSLEKVGFNQYFYGGAEKDLTEAKNPVIKQGQLEGSNVNAIKSMTGLILAHRSFEAYQKAIRNFDTMMEKSSNSIGEVRA